MKKWMIGLLGGIGLVWISVYIFIPNTLWLKNNTAIRVTVPGIHRMLLDKKNVAKWWPGKIGNDSFYLNGYNYKIAEGNITVLPVFINGQNIDLASSLFLISNITDSTQLGWVVSMPTSYNPVKRFLTYLEAKKIHRDMKTILEKMEKFYSNPKNIYEFEIKDTVMVDGILIAYIGRCKSYPTTAFVYNLIDKLRNYASINAAKESGYPMLNIRPTDNINFDYIVALPIDKILPSSGDILQKRLPGRCKMLMTEVKGGIRITTRALQQIQHYSDDHQLKAPALPFYSLVTERAKEQDTNKWVTKIYFPVL